MDRRLTCELRLVGARSPGSPTTMVDRRLCGKGVARKRETVGERGVE